MPLYSSQSILRVRDLESGQVVWTRTTSGEFDSAALAQLDADAALEVIAGHGPGLVFDGALGLTEWTYPAGLEHVVSGRFDDSDPISFASVAQSRVVYFRNSPLSPVQEQQHFAAPADSAVANFDLDAPDEIAIAGSGDIHIPTPGRAKRYRYEDVFPIGGGRPCP